MVFYWTQQLYSEGLWPIDSVWLSPHQIDDIKQGLSLKRTEEVDRQKQIGITRRMIQDLQTELDRMGSQEDITPKIEAVNTELKRIQEEKSRLEGKRQDLSRDRNEAMGELRRKTFCKLYMFL